MYTDFFGLGELPFNNTPDPRFFYPTPDHEEALASLIYAVQERKGFVLLTGEVGAGKTLVARMMLRRFGKRLAFATVSHGIQDATDLLQSVCTEFELPVQADMKPAQLVRLLHDFLLDRFASDSLVALVLDEAQSLPLDAFEQLRMIGNLEADDAKLLQVVIVGQTELQRRFSSREFCQLRQRIFRSFHLPAMSREATEGYILHRLSIAGAQKRRILDAGAIDAIYDFSKGLPRIINTLCDNAMLSAYSADRRDIDVSFVESVIGQMMMAGPKSPSIATRVEEDSRRRLERTTRVPPAGGDPGESERSTAARVVELSMSVDAVVARVAEAVEARLRPQLARRGVETGATESGAGAGRDDTDEKIQAVMGELATIRKGLTEKFEDIAQRLAGLEHRRDSAAPWTSDARSARTSLESRLQQVATTVEMAANASRQLQQREVDLREFAAKLTAAGGEARTLLDSLNRTVGKAGSAERSANEIFHRLVAKSDQSRRLADGVRLLLSRFANLGITPDSLPRILRQVTKPRHSASADMPATPGEPAAPPPAPDHLQALLSNTRASLSELRSLVSATNHPPQASHHARATACEPDSTGNPSDAGCTVGKSVPLVHASAAAEASTSTRLADRLEGLVRMIESTPA